MKQAVTLFLTIIATGAFLHAARDGRFGGPLATMALYAADGFDTDK